MQVKSLYNELNLTKLEVEKIAKILGIEVKSLSKMKYEMIKSFLKGLDVKMNTKELAYALYRVTGNTNANYNYSIAEKILAKQSVITW